MATVSIKWEKHEKRDTLQTILYNIQLESETTMKI